MGERYPEVQFDGIIWDKERKRLIYACLQDMLLNVVERTVGLGLVVIYLYS